MEIARADEIARACETYVVAAAAGRGAIVFVAGPPGSGRSALLAGLRRRLADEEPKARIVAGRMREGRYVADAPRRGRLGAAAETSIALVAAGGTAAVNPIVQLVAHVGEAALAARGLVSESPSLDASTFERLLHELRRSARERPLVCLIDDCDDADGRWWSEFLLGLANEVATDLPLFLFVTVDSSATDPKQLAADAPDALVAARILTSKGQAEWWSLGTVEPEILEPHMGAAEPSVLNRIRRLSDGRPSWARDLWREWIEIGAIERDTDLGPWRFAPGDPAAASTALAPLLRKRLMEASGGDPHVAAELQDILACGALQGMSFVAEAVADALGLDKDRVIDLLDAPHLQLDPEHPRGLVAELGSVSLVGDDGMERHVWRYGFGSAVVGAAAIRNAFTAGRASSLSGALADSLQRLHGAAVSQIAPQLARLCRRAGRSAEAERWREMANANMPDDAIVEMAWDLVGAESQRLAPDEARRGLPILLDAADILSERGSAEDTYEIATWAAAFARAFGHVEGEARALLIQGYETSIPELERSHLESARALFESIGALGGKAAASGALASLASREGERAVATQFADEALSIERWLRDPGGQLAVHMVRARIGLRFDDLAEARQAIAAAKLLGEYADTAQAAALAEVEAEVAWRAGDRDAAISAVEIAARLFAAAGDLRREADALLSLGNWQVAQRAEDGTTHPGTRATLERAVDLAERVEDIDVQMEGRHGLARLSLLEGNYDRGIDELRRVKAANRAHGRPMWAPAAVDLASALDEAGDERSAQSEFELVWAATVEAGEWSIAWIAMLGLIAIDLNRRRYEAVEQTVRERLELIDRAAPLPVRAAAHYRLGQSILSQDRFAEARRELRIAVRLAKQCEDLAAVEEAEKLLAVADEFEQEGRSVREEADLYLRVSTYSY